MQNSKSILTILLMILLIVVLVNVTPASAIHKDFTPGWDSFRQNNQNTAFIETPGPARPEILWVLDLSKEEFRFDTTPAISTATDTVIIGGSNPDVGRVYALDLFGYYNGFTSSTQNNGPANLSTAEIKWSVDTARISDSSAAIDDGIVFYGDQEGALKALNLYSGLEIWSFQTGAEIHSSPVIVGESVLIGSYDSKLYSLNKTTGKEQWNNSMSYWVHATPAVYGSLVFSGFCGEVLNVIDFDTGNTTLEFKCGGYVISSPAISEGNVYFGDYQGNFYSVNITNFEENWNVSAGSNIFSSPAISSDKVYFGADNGNVYSYYTGNGTLAWSYETGAAVKSSPAVAGDSVFIGSNDGNIYSFNSTTGELNWKYDLGSEVAGSPAVAEGLMLIATTGGKVYAFGETNVTAPAVLEVYPVNLETGIDPRVTIKIVFSVPMDDENINKIIQIDPPVTGRKSVYNLESNTLFFYPVQPLMENTTYSIGIPAGTVDRTGNRLGMDYNWSFTTGFMDPPNGNGGKHPPDTNGTDDTSKKEGIDRFMIMILAFVIIIFIAGSLTAILMKNKKKRRIQ